MRIYSAMSLLTSATCQACQELPYFRVRFGPRNGCQNGSHFGRLPVLGGVPGPPLPPFWGGWRYTKQYINWRDSVQGLNPSLTEIPGPQNQPFSGFPAPSPYSERLRTRKNPKNGQKRVFWANSPNYDILVDRQSARVSSR